MDAQAGFFQGKAIGCRAAVIHLQRKSSNWCKSSAT